MREALEHLTKTSERREEARREIQAMIGSFGGRVGVMHPGRRGMPAAEVMLDSNVLVYALSDAPPERKKRKTAAALLAEQDFGTPIKC